ncbi:MAG: TonB-dependent receptor [Bacteroidetes bacterium]|nr:TonB-dependent receptor [Bacteroidota bacterium]
MKITKLIGVCCFVIAFLNVQAQTDTASFNEMSLEQLLNVEVSVASSTNLNNRETPGIVSVITAEEIEAMNATDITDVLKRIPGMELGCDVEGVLGLGIRGNWAHEGKVLLLINGIEMNESLYATLPLEHNYPADMIEKIEIIRGPGSAMYGGAAAYAVIDVRLKSANKQRGIIANSSISAFKNALASQVNNIYVGNKTSNYSYSIIANRTTAIRGNRYFTDVYGNAYDMAKESDIENNLMAINLNVRGYNIDVVFYDYNIFSRDGYDAIFSQAYYTGFKAGHAKLSKKIELNEKFSFTPTIGYKNEKPWNFNDDYDTEEYEPFDITVTEWRSGISFTYCQSEKFNLVCGGEMNNEKAVDNNGEIFSSNNKTSITNNNAAIYAQGVLKTNLANFTIGCRANFNSIYENTFVPRIGLTKAWEKFHLKALLSQAYRAPSIQNTDANTSIQPEKSLTAEVEIGAQLTNNLSISVNGFDMSTTKTIVYSYDDVDDDDNYLNAGKSGTRGFETELKFKNKANYFGIAYSFYSTGKQSTVENYMVPQNADMQLAFPAHKIYGYVNISLNSKLHVQPQLEFKGPRYGITSYNEETDERYYQKINAMAVCNIMINSKALLAKNLNIAFGVKNIFNANDVLIQPYYDLHAPIPGKSREAILKLTYHFNFK